MIDPDPPEEDPREGITDPNYDEYPDYDEECIYVQVTNYNPNEIPF